MEKVSHSMDLLNAHPKLRGSLPTSLYPLNAPRYLTIVNEASYLAVQHLIKLANTVPINLLAY